jgi:hypothetical protein
VCISVAPRMDLPETAFNEIDSPVNEALPVLPRIHLIHPAGEPVGLPRPPLDCAGCGHRGFVHETEAMASQRYPDSLQDLLCTFLI